jgi:hypothetical protein
MIVLAPLIVREFVQHRIDNLLQRQKQIRIVVIPQTNADFVPAVDIQTKQVSLWW